STLLPIMNSLFCCALIALGLTFSQGVDAACVDLQNPATGQSDCGVRRNLCNDPNYFSLMTTQCPVTCGRCPSVPNTCVDLVNPITRVSDCPQTAYKCNDPVYFSFMTTQCPRTCGRCPPGGK
ncbi:hypothetical protein PENTCL1PPCAC_14173, partial [Pristionchus entomophagus]